MTHRTALCAFALGLNATFAQPPRHDRVVVVPAPGAIATDGSLEDWDLSGAIECAFDESLKPKFTARIGLMYDADALYIGARFNDGTPLRNRHDPAVEPDKGWAGDALQVRLCTDPKAKYPLASSNSDRICHLTIWFYTDQKLPVLHISHGMDYHGTKVLSGRESGVAFRDDADGYVLEARVPWTLLNAGGPPPKARDRVGLVVQPLWGDGSGWKHVCTFNDVIREVGFSFQGATMWGQALFSAKGNLKPTETPGTVQEALTPLSLDLPLPDAGAKSLSAAVFSAEGQLVRTLPVTTLGEPADGQSLTIKWDGLDDDGRPLPPSQYVVKTLSHRGIGQKWIASLHNAGNPPWRTDDGTGAWGADHGPPIAAAADSERVYLGWTISEAGRAVIAVKTDFTSDGKVQKLWGQRQVHDLGIIVTALAADGERVFVAQDGGPWGRKKGTKGKAGVVLWDAKSGKPINFPFGKRALVISDWSNDLKPPELKTAERLSIFHSKIPRKRFWQRLRDHDFGPQELGLNLLGVAVAGDTLYASLYLESKIVAINWRAGKTLAEYQVPKPAGLAVATDGTIIAVSAQQLVRLNPNSGQLSVIVSTGLSSPWGVALDGRGKIYVSDCGDSMQVKAFDRDGKRDAALGKAGGRPWVGRYEPRGMLRPAGITVDAAGKLWVTEHDNTPRRISVWSRDGKLIADLLGAGSYAVEGITDEQNPRFVNVHHTLFEVDYRTGRAKTLATLIRPQRKGFSFTPDKGFMGRALKFRHVRDKTFAVHTGRGGVVVYRVGDDWICEPVAALGPGKSLPLHGFTKDDLPASVKEAYWRRSHEYGFWWCDTNGDGLVQNAEMAIEKASPFWQLYWGCWIDDDLTIWSASRGDVWRVPVEQWLPNGAPVYPKPSKQKPLFSTLGDRIQHVMPDGDAVYVMEQKKGDGRGGGAEWMAVSRYTRDGKRLWAYRRVWLGFGLEAPLSKPGDVVGALKFIGKVKLDRGPTLVAVNGYFGHFNVLSDTGLWVTSLCKDNRYGPPAGHTTVWPENFSGFLFRNTENGRFYLIAGDTDSRIWEITGLDSIRTSESNFSLSGKDHEQALAAALRKQGAPSENPPIALLPAEGITVDGDLADWDLSQAPELNAGAGRGAKAALRYTAEHLLVAFQVQDRSPMRNQGGDFGLLFKTGDACDVMLATSGRNTARAVLGQGLAVSAFPLYVPV